MTLAVPLALAAVLAANDLPAPPPGPGAAPPAARTIRVSGEGHAFATPDVARVVVGVEARHPTSLARAAAEATARMRKVLAALEKGGVASRDVRTVRHDVEVQRSYERSSAGAVTGYLVTNRVAVTVRDLARLGALLDEVVAAGANAIDGLVLAKEDPSAERARALEGAVADARAKAAALARAAGVTLGDVLQVVEAGPGPSPVADGMVALSRANAAAVPVAAGQLELVATVEVVLAIR